MKGAVVLLVFFTILIGYVAGTVSANALLLKRCLGFSYTLGVILLLVPGLNMIGAFLVAISGLMQLLGKCKACNMSTPAQ